MFRYINMPKLVATYLREFSCNVAGRPSALYKFVFCLCLPFVSTTFRRARLIALAIAECTNSGDQIARVLYAITGARLEYTGKATDYTVSYDASGQGFTEFFAAEAAPLVPYSDPTNTIIADIYLNGASRSDVEAYLSLLVPFYINVTINWKN